MNWWVCCYWHEPDAPTDPVGLVRIWALADALASGGDDVTVLAGGTSAEELIEGLSIGVGFAGSLAIRGAISPQPLPW